MNKLRRLIRWFIPMGWAIKDIQRYRDVIQAVGVLTYQGMEVSIYKLKPTPFKGVFLAYSKDEYNREINFKIERLRQEITWLKGELK